MGTSKGLSTPSGGQWTGVRREINTNLEDIGVLPGAAKPPDGAATVVQSVVQAIGGLGFGIPSGSAGGGSGMGRGGGRTGGGSTGSGGGRGRASAGRSRAVGKSIAGLGGFGAAVRDGGLTEALRQIDLSSLQGRSAVEVISRVAERLADGSDGVNAELLRTALNETILEAAQLEEQLAYSDLEAGLQSFLNTEGLEGLISIFLSKLVTDLVTARVFEHVDQRAESAAQIEAFLIGIDAACRSRAGETVEKYRADGRFNQIDWFGTAGTHLGREIADALLADLGATP